MASSAVAAYGTLFKMGDGASPETFTTIAELTHIGLPEMSATEADVTNYSSTSGIAETLPTILKPGQITLTMNFIVQDSTQNYTAGLIYKWKNRIKTNYKVTFTDPGTTSWIFPAYVTKVKPSTDLDKQNMLDVTLSVTGVPTLA